MEAKFRESYSTTWLFLKQIWFGLYLQPRKKCFLLKYSTNIQKQHLIFTVHIRFLVQENGRRQESFGTVLINIMTLERVRREFYTETKPYSWDVFKQHRHLPCLNTPIKRDLSASLSHQSVGTSAWKGSGIQTSASLKKDNHLNNIQEQ